MTFKEKGCLRLLAGAVIGLLVGLGVRAFLLLPPSWEKLPPTASAVTEISTERLGGCSGALYVRTADGSLLQLSGLNEDMHWMPESDQKVCAEFYRLSEPCDPLFHKTGAPASDFSPQQCLLKTYPYVFSSGGGIARCDLSSRPFSLLTFPPTGIKACLQSWDQFGEYSTVQAYVLDSRGNLWQWYYRITLRQVGPVVPTTVDFGMLAVFCCPIVGIVLALLPLEEMNLRNSSR